MSETPRPPTAAGHEPADLQLEVLADHFMVVKIPAGSPRPEWADRAASLTAVVRTETEHSIVAPAHAVPADVPAVGPWRALRVQGPLSFELTGILASLATPLARAGVSIFAISTYDTDYVLVRAESLARAVEALRGAGHGVRIEA